MQVLIPTWKECKKKTLSCQVVFDLFVSTYEVADLGKLEEGGNENKVGELVFW